SAWLQKPRSRMTSARPGTAAHSVAARVSFARAVRAEGGGGDEVLAQDRERDQPQLRVARALPVATARAAEVRDVLPRVGHAQRRAVEAVDGQPAPAGGGGRRGAPHRGGLREERRQ